MMEAIPSATGESPAADGFFRYRKGDRSIIPTLLGLQIIAWVTAGEQRSLFLFPACVLMSGTGGVLMTNDENCLLRRKKKQKTLLFAG